MYRLFTLQNYNKGSFSKTNINRLIESLKWNIDPYTARLNIYGCRIPSNHLLMRLCYQLAALKDGYVSDFLVEESKHVIYVALDITSESTRGDCIDNQFYTSKAIAYAADYSLESFNLDWKELRPVRVISHPYLNISLLPMPMSKKRCQPGLSMVGIDIVLFNKMFREWNEINRLKPLIEQEGFSSFISKWILPGMMPEYINAVIRNRIGYILNNKELPINSRLLSNISTIQTGLDSEYKKILLHPEKWPDRYTSMLDMIQLPYGTYLEAFPKELISLSAYNYWATLIGVSSWAIPVATIIEHNSGDKDNIHRVMKAVGRYVVSSDAILSCPIKIRTHLKQQLKDIKEKIE